MINTNGMPNILLEILYADYEPPIDYTMQESSTAENLVFSERKLRRHDRC